MVACRSLLHCAPPTGWLLYAFKLMTAPCAKACMAMLKALAAIQTFGFANACLRESLGGLALSPLGIEKNVDGARNAAVHHGFFRIHFFKRESSRAAKIHTACGMGDAGDDVIPTNRLVSFLWRAPPQVIRPGVK